MNTRRVTLIVAVVLALGAGILTIRFLGQYASQQQVAAPASPPKDVLIATEDIQARAKITPDMLLRTQRPSDVAGPDAISDPKLVDGDISLVAIHKDSVVTTTIVGRPPESTLTVTLKPGMRALTIPIDRVKAVAGLLQPGDRVDVVAVPPKVGNRPPVASTIIRGAMVMALNNSTDTSGATPSPDNAGAGTVTLGVTPKQANLLAMADLNTTLRLALRSPQEPVRSLPPDDLVFDEGPASPAPQVLFAPQPVVPNVTADPDRDAFLRRSSAVAVAPPMQGVQVIDGSTVISGAGATK